MTSTQDTEITLGTGKLLALFFGLVGIVALFFALGYSLGKQSGPGVTTASAAAPQAATSANKASGGSAPPMTFYKSVEQKNANPELTPPETDKGNKNDSPDSAAAPPAGSQPAQTPATTGADPATMMPSSAYFVQVAAVSKQEDADSLVDALKKKEYPAFVAAAVSTDKLFRVQLGPFADVKDAEAMRTKLVGDGYSPILKK